MLRRVILVWFTANFLLVGIAGLLLRRWYLALPSLDAMLVELGLIMAPNLLLPALVLRFAPSFAGADPWKTLGWKWPGPRALVAGVAALGAIATANWLIGRLVGPSIPYELPGGSTPIRAAGVVQAAGLLLLLVSFVTLTTAGEETMFRGFIQGQVATVHGPWVGLALGAVLFGLRHLPADLFYGSAWSATPLMWASRELQLYVAALLLGLARHFGRSTYASAIVHVALLLTALFG